jgi:glycosyltransferase involved in cell wall biosynthesis
VPGVVELGFVPDAVLAWLYRRATAVLLPSLYEGCGLPCAEALGLGTPVIHSGLGALPEVAGDHGAAVPEPLRPASWSGAMAHALEGRLPRLDPETAASVRTAHDVRLVGRQYWNAVHTALSTAGFASRAG